jgi:hypothetical protein
MMKTLCRIWVAACLGAGALALDASASGLSPIPSKGPVPPMVEPDAAIEQEHEIRAKRRQYERQVKTIANKHFGSVKVEAIRVEGLAKLKEFTDPASFRPMFEVVADEKDDVRLSVLDHFQSQGEGGHGALAWVAIHAEDASMRHEATKRIPTPASTPVMRELDSALRSPKHAVANNAGALAGSLHVVSAIPLLIFAQATEDSAPREGQGDLAWIAIQTSTAFVSNVQPVVGDGAGGFAPVIGVVREGVLMRVHDAVVVNYRMDIHHALVNMTSTEMGEPTERLGYNMREWWAWYNDEFVPRYNAKHAAASAAK